MAVRYSERQADFKKLSRRKYTTPLTRAELASDTDIHEISFARGITVISGGNGAGKSSTLGSLWQCLSGVEKSPPLPVRVPHWLAKITVTGEHEGSAWATSFDATSFERVGECPAPVKYIDTSSETEQLLSLFRQDENLDDLLDGIDPSELDTDQVDWISYVLKRPYESVSVFEVTAFSSNDEPIPFFEVSSTAGSYNLLAMGRGELSAIYLIWQLGNIPKGSIVLLEEPESHLATFSQKALHEAMIAASVARDLTFVISSHSPGFINGLPPKSVVLVSSRPPSIRCGLDISEVSSHLGMSSSRDGILIAEDVVAAYLLSYLLKITAPDIAERVAVKYAKSGESGVKRAVAEISSALASDRFAVLGVLDGDQKNDKPEDADRYGFLMGEVAPDQLMRDLTDRWRAGEFPSWNPNFANGDERLRMTLELLDGEDHHDWITELAKRYDGYTRVIGELVQLCLQDPVLAEEGNRLVEWLRSKLA